MLATIVALIPLLWTQSVVGAPLVGSYNDWNSVGCYEDSVSARALPHIEQLSGGMTIEKCLDACHTSGYAFAGLEWSQECFCGSSLPPTSATDGRCNMSCQGDVTEICGGSLGLSVYQYTSSNLTNYKTWSYDDCYVDSIWNRVLPNSKSVSGPMTIEKCLDACDAAGYEYAGVEYGGECWGGNAKPTQVTNDGRCNMACSGDVSELCGGSNGLSVYHSTGVPQPIDEYNGSKFSGCYKDSTQNRVLPQRAAPEHDYDQTVEICIDACNALGYRFAALENGSECWCGNSRPGDLATDGRCSMRCVGNHQERCGGPDGIDVYESHPQTTTTTTQTTQTSTSTTETPSPTIFPYRVAVYRTADDLLLGYIAQQNGAFILPVYTADPVAALLVVTEGPKSVPQGGSCIDLREVNPPDISHPYLAAYYGTSLYNIQSAITQTPPGSTRQPTGSTRSSVAEGESCIWRLDSSTLALSQFWAEDNGTSTDRHLFFYGSGTTGYFMGTTNPVAFLAQFPTALPVRFALEEALPLI